MVAADEEYLMAVQVGVAVDGIGHQLHGEKDGCWSRRGGRLPGRVPFS